MEILLAILIATPGQAPIATGDLPPAEPVVEVEAAPPEPEVEISEGDPFGVEEEDLDDVFGGGPEKGTARIGPHDLRLRIGLGGRLFFGEGSHQASDYEHVQHCPCFDATIHSYGGGLHRLRIDGMIRNSHDYNADATYGYGEILQLRITALGTHHAADRAGLIDLGADPRYGVSLGDLLENPARDSNSGRLRIALKWPGFPVHLYLDGWFHHRHSATLQTFLGGSGHFDNLLRIQEPFHGEDLFYDGAISLNSHLGPVEALFKHREYALNQISPLTSYAYDGALPLGQGEYAHDYATDFHGRSDELTINTDTSGMFTLAGRLQRATVINPRSDLSGTTWAGNLVATHHPVTRFTLRGSLSGRLTNWTGPGIATVTEIGTGEVVSVPTAMPQDRDELISRLRLRYRVLRGTTLDLRYRRVDLRRPDGEAWHLSPYTVRNRVGTRVKLRASRTLRLEAGYQHEWIAAPSLNTEFDSWGRAEFSAIWSPSQYFTAHGRYQYSLGERETLAYEMADVSVRGGARRTGSHNAMGSLRVATGDGLSLMLMWNYLQVRVGQDLAYSSWSTTAGEPFVRDPGAVYQQNVHQVMGDLSWKPVEWLGGGLRVGTNSSEARLTPMEPLALEPISIGSFAADRIFQLRAETYVRVTLESGWSGALMGGWREIDFGDNPFDPRLKGRIKTIAFSVDRTFE